MSAPSMPTNFIVQQGNGQVYLSWSLVAGASSYDIQKSEDGVTYTSLANPTANSYLDILVATGTLYYYKVASQNNDGIGLYTEISSIIPTPTSEMSLGGIRLAAQQRAEMVNSQYLTVPEWNFFINQACYELYDLLITAYEDYFMAPRARFTTQSGTYQYPLPNGVLTFQDQNGQDFVAQPFYKLLGVDLGLNTASNAFVTVNKYNLIDRNRFVYPNTASTLYGVFNMRYRMLGTNLEFIPTPSSGQPIQLLYIPRLPQLLKDTDITTIGFSGWLQYVIIRAAKYALDKEESDTTKLDAELVYLKQRIEETAVNRDAGQPDRVSDIRGNMLWGPDSGYGSSGGSWGGF